MGDWRGSDGETVRHPRPANWASPAYCEPKGFSRRTKFSFGGRRLQNPKHNIAQPPDCSPTSLIRKYPALENLIADVVEILTIEVRVAKTVWD